MGVAPEVDASGDWKCQIFNQSRARAREHLRKIYLLPSYRKITLFRKLSQRKTDTNETRSPRSEDTTKSLETEARIVALAIVARGYLR